MPLEFNPLDFRMPMRVTLCEERREIREEFAV